MSKNKHVAWIVGVALGFALVLLIGLQYLYYDGIATLRLKQTKQLAQLALSSVGEEIEMRELVRHILNKESLKLIDLKDPSSLSRSAQLSQDTLWQEHKLRELLFENRSTLEGYVLQRLYHSKNFDSIPQFVNPRHLQDMLRRELEMKGINELYYLVLRDSKGKVLFEYAEPGLLHPEDPDEGIYVNHTFFISERHPDRPSPVLTLWLDVKPIPWYSRPFLPGIVLGLLILVLAVAILVLVTKQENLQEEKNNFVNNMTHELKTPVSSIMLASTMLRHLRYSKGEDQAEKRERYLSIIDHESGRLEKLIDRVLQISLFDRNKSNIRMQQLDLNELILKVGQAFSLQIEAQGGELELDLLANNTLVLGSETHLTNVIYNLLENAVKYRKPELPPQISIHTYNMEERIVLVVSDNGIGIPPAGLRNIFKRYYRVNQGLRHDVKGFGLGLAYVQAMVKHHKGRIVVESAVGEGTQISIGLPNIIQS